MSSIAANLQRLREEIAEQVRACGRQPEEVRLLAVSKTFPPPAVVEALGAGQTLFGENRVQEAEEKIPRCPPEARWHLIGHLQSNKARRAVELFDVIETLDSPKLARRLGRIAAELSRTVEVLIQVNVGHEPQKFGVEEDEVEGLAAVVDAEPNLRLRGLMTIPPWDLDPEAVRPYFRRLRQALETLNRGRAEPLRELSMGMSGDWRVAVQEGSTLLRIGTTIFGPRSA